MAPTPLEQPFDHMAARSFSFFPPIVGIEHNEWLLRQVNWSEVLVANQGTEQELWIPRRYFGAAGAGVVPKSTLGGLEMAASFSTVKFGLGLCRLMMG